MKPYTVLIFLITIGFTTTAQKPALDTSVFSDWPFVTNLIISNDGNYVMYNIRREPYGAAPKRGSLVIQAVQNKWKLEIPNVIPSPQKTFSANNQTCFFLNKGDSLGIVTLSNGQITFVPNVRSFKVFQAGGQEYLVYQSKTTAKELVIKNLLKEYEVVYKNVNAFQLSADGGTILIVKDSVSNGTTNKILCWVDVPSGTGKVIWNGSNAGSIVFNNAGDGVAFVGGDKTVWLYKKNTDRAVELITNRSAGMPEGLEPDGINFFNENDQHLFITLSEKKMEPEAGAVSVDIWSYRDAVIQSEQLESGSHPCLAVYNLTDHRLVCIQYEDEIIRGYTGRMLGKTALIVKRKGNVTEWNWNREAQSEYFSVNTITGERKKIEFFTAIWAATMSPGGRFALLDVGRGADLYTYETRTSIIRNITKDFPVPVGSSEYDQPLTKLSRGLRGALWMNNDAGLLVYDEFDIWQIDPENKVPPKCLTNGFGRKNKTVFRLTDLQTEGKLVDGQEVIVNSFNKKNKESGFYNIRIGKSADPVLLSAGPFDYSPNPFEFGPVKAPCADVYIIRRQSALQSPNFFWTKDFKSFNQLSDIHPERAYNWLTAGLITFQTVDGRNEQAVMYKPENFDPSKKYPVIIHYYERKTQELNIFQRPGDDTGGELDISWFVSHGYIVVMPDIHFKTGEPGQSAYNSIVGVRNYLVNFPWVKINAIGIQGHSFGGYETNYVITHTSIFTAACSSSGISDFTSNYLGFLSAHTNHEWFEKKISRLGSTLWEKPELYIKNSPVFYADKITTPLLLVSNKKDRNVEFSQGVELFNAMRRLGKTVWMLQYDEGGHGLGGNEYIDYVIRMTQFFDFYLKGTFAPKWMLNGIPARMKRIDNGFELDTTGKKPGEGLLRTIN